MEYVRQAKNYMIKLQQVFSVQGWFGPWLSFARAHTQTLCCSKLVRGAAGLGTRLAWWGKDPRAESWWDNLVVLPQATVGSSHSPGTAACPCLVSVPQLRVPGACWGWVSPTATHTPVTCLSPAPRTSQPPCSYQKHLGAGDGSCCSGAGTQLVPLRLRGPAPACASWDFPPLL